MCSGCCDLKKRRQEQRLEKPRLDASGPVGVNGVDGSAFVARGSDYPVLVGHIAGASVASVRAGTAVASVRDGSSDSPVLVGRIAGASVASLRDSASDSPVIVCTTRTRRSLKTTVPVLCGCGCDIADNDVGFCGVLNTLCPQNNCLELIRVDCGKSYRTCLKHKKEPKGVAAIIRIPGNSYYSNNLRRLT